MPELNIHEILQCIPQRFPFIMIDRVLEYVVDERLVAVKNVTLNEPYFAGHFPGNPVMPGVLIIESLAQASAVLAHLTNKANDTEKSIQLFAGIDNARFKRMVMPGDQLRLETEIVAYRKGVWKTHATATVNGQLACSADLISATKGE